MDISQPGELGNETKAGISFDIKSMIMRDSGRMREGARLITIV